MSGFGHNCERVQAIVPCIGAGILLAVTLNFEPIVASTSFSWLTLGEQTRVISRECRRQKSWNFSYGGKLPPMKVVEPPTGEMGIRLALACRIDTDGAIASRPA